MENPQFKKLVNDLQQQNKNTKKNINEMQGELRKLKTENKQIQQSCDELQRKVIKQMQFLADNDYKCRQEAWDKLQELLKQIPAHNTKRKKKKNNSKKKQNKKKKDNNKKKKNQNEDDELQKILKLSQVIH
ncbi:hypothetical protein M0812_28802 [Anaeramoeba flamelloides]|uniref:Uncharacterized protein n=1 Tax=Anaeramoeba flamelloides TaxID=1746091 RepID=A0AAV7YFM4_9EUKA|nr:hypothetical protein M0812_28802 [Anaeramoeba flamelloides]